MAVQLVGPAGTAGSTAAARMVDVGSGSAGAATTTTPGLVALATTAEATTGTDTAKAMTPARTKEAIDARGFYTAASGTISTAGLLQLSTATEAATGTDTAKAVTPAGVKAALNAYVAGPPPVTLTEAATIATNAAAGNLFRVTLTASRTLGIPTNPTDGQRVMWELIASGGPWTVTLTTGSAGAFAFGTSITALGAIASGTTTFLGCIYRSSSARWHVLAISEGH